MRTAGIRWAWKLVVTGKIIFLFSEIWMRFYKAWWEFSWKVKRRVSTNHSLPQDFEIQLQTDNPVAFESPDHLVPWGTSRDNSTNKKFVDTLAARLRAEFPRATLGALDLGCSGGQLVKDFSSIGWLAVGLEGSDFSLKHGRANWPALAGKNLFTCDITKPFSILTRGRPAKFHLITMWEVLEHIHQRDLKQLFDNIMKHLISGGYFVASTTSEPDVHDGFDLHQTQWTNKEWKEWLGKNYSELECIKLNLRYYQYVRHSRERSFLSLRRTR